MERFGLACLIWLLLCRLPRTGRRNAITRIKHSVNGLPWMALNLIRAADVATAAVRHMAIVAIEFATFLTIGVELGSFLVGKEKSAYVSWQVGDVFIFKTAVISV